MFKRLGPTTPPMRARRAKDAKWLLSGHNRFRVKTYSRPQPYSPVWGEHAQHAANRMRYWLGYPSRNVKTGLFGEQLYSYLLPLSSSRARRLPLAYQVRRKLRLAKAKAQQATPNTKALEIALNHVGLEESPFGSNRQKFGAWYGWNGVAWCAQFVSYCYSHAGSAVKTALAFQFEYWANARSGGWRRTFSPEPGDVVVYRFGQGHVGIFKRWINRTAGTFEAVEGNTSVTSDDNGGKVMIRMRDIGSGRPFFATRRR